MGSIVSSSEFYEEFEEFVKNRKRIVFAYSGGLDSSVVLHLLNAECKARGVLLCSFTIDHGFKGERVLENMRSVVKFEGLEKTHKVFDISKNILSDGTIVRDYYSSFCNKMVVPCGPKCNCIIDSQYTKVLAEFGESFLVTGGDTPIFNEKSNKYSIFWQKKDFCVVRGGAIFGLTKKGNREFIKKNNIPWVDPECGGYDTDCLIPGGVLKSMVDSGLSVEEIHKRVPQIKEYLSDREKVGVLSAEEFNALKKELDLPKESSFNEYKRLSKV